MHTQRHAQSQTTVFLIALFVAHNALAVDSFISAGPLAAPRYGANASLLGNGSVLIAGGRGLLGATTAAEIYESSTNSFGATGNMVGAYIVRASVRLADGRLLIAGGVDNASHATIDAELYNPASGTFTATGSLGTKRYAAAAALLPNGNVLIAGGIDSSGNTYLRNAEIYDHTLGTFAGTGSLVLVRAGATATALPNGKVLIAGGGDQTSVWASAELYDPGTGTFAYSGNFMSTPRADGTATLLTSGKVLIVGGYSDTAFALSADIYDPATDTFTATGSLPSGRLAASAALLSDGKVLIAGGADPNNIDNSIASAELYDPATGLFSAAASMVAARQDAPATALSGGRVLIAGGSDFDGAPLSSAEVYIANVIFRGAFDSP